VKTIIAFIATGLRWQEGWGGGNRLALV